jgi:hypothetical protein
MFKKLRVLILLYILLMVAAGGWLNKARTTDWNEPLEVVVYAINGDKSSATQKYIDNIENSDFNDIEVFFQREAERYNLALKKPVDVSYAGELNEKPPMPPHGGSPLSTLIWSLKLRYWAWKNDDYPYPEDIQIFVIYFDPEKTKAVDHSLGLQKGLIGVVNAFASKDMKKSNHVVIAHELLHTVGAIDKYDPDTNQPIYPVGFADSEQEPLFPQEKAEIMAGRIAINDSEAKQPEKLKQVVLNEATAIEINWIREE